MRVRSKKLRSKSVHSASLSSLPLSLDCVAESLECAKLLRALDMTLEAPPRTPLPEDAIDGKKLATKDARARSRLDPDAGASESEI